MRGALSALLGLEPDLEVVAEVGSGDAVLPAVLEHRPDVALLDVEMPGLDGIAATAEVRRGRARHPGADRDHVRSARLPAPRAPGRRLRVRRQGHARRPSSPTPYDGCTRACASSTPPWRPTAWSPASRRSPPARPTCSGPPATARSVAAIAAKLFLSEGTVRNHLSSAIGKTGATNRAEAVLTAEGNGWL